MAGRYDIATGRTPEEEIPKDPPQAPVSPLRNPGVFRPGDLVRSEDSFQLLGVVVSSDNGTVDVDLEGRAGRVSIEADALSPYRGRDRAMSQQFDTAYGSSPIRDFRSTRPNQPEFYLRRSGGGEVPIYVDNMNMSVAHNGEGVMNDVSISFRLTQEEMNQLNSR